MTTPIYSEQERDRAAVIVHDGVTNENLRPSTFTDKAIDLQCALTRTQAALADSENLLRRIGLSSDQPEIRKAIDDFLARAR